MKLHQLNKQMRFSYVFEAIRGYLAKGVNE